MSPIAPLRKKRMQSSLIEDAASRVGIASDQYPDREEMLQSQESYNKIIGQMEKDRKSGRLMKKSDLAGVIGYGASDTEGETYVPTEQEYQRNNPNSNEFKAEAEKRKQEGFDRANKEKERMNRLKVSKPWLFGYGAGAYVQQGPGLGSVG
jgi:hypothetical protein